MFGTLSQSTTLTSFARRTVAGGLAALTLTAAPVPVQAEAIYEGTFDVVFRGIVAGRATYRANENARNYAVSALMQSTGLLSIVADVRVSAEVTGGRNGSGYVPRRYRDEAKVDGGVETLALSWSGGIPMIEKVTPVKAAEPDALDPRQQRGTVDPLTALFNVLRDVTPEKACTAKSVVYDGRRRTQLSLSNPTTTGTRVTCKGEFRRLAGFSVTEMSQRSSFPFSLSYEPNENGTLRVVEVVIDTSYGPTRLVRR